MKGLDPSQHVTSFGIDQLYSFPMQSFFLLYFP